MRMFICLAIMLVMAHFNVRVGLLGLLLAFAFLIAFAQDARELAKK